MEIQREQVPGMKNYQVSNTGEVRNINWRSPGRVRNLTPCCDRDGYLVVCLSPNGKQCNYRVHRLVAMAFLPVAGMDKLQVNHKDENKDNNCVSNLEWVDCIENNNYGTRNARVAASKLNTNSKPVTQYDLSGRLIATFPSGHEVKRRLGLDNTMIARCCTGKAKTAYGYVWRYEIGGTRE